LGRVERNSKYQGGENPLQPFVTDNLERRGGQHVNAYQQGFQNQQSFNQFQQPFNQAQTNRYQPVGFVQSQFQGIPKQSNFGYQNTTPVLSHVGLTAQNQQFGTSVGTRAVTPYNPVIAHTGLTAAQQQSQGFAPQGTFTQSLNPVIAHAGLTAGQQQQSQGFGVQGTYTGTFTQSANPVISHAGLTAGSSQSSVATGAQFGAYATNVAQPVISHVGYTAGQDFSRNQYAGQQAIGQFGTSSFTQSARAVTPFNPVLQATNAAASQGPVVSKLGYSAGQQTAQSGYGSFPK
jgi:hypothetical protein